MTRDILTVKANVHPAPNAGWNITAVSGRPRTPGNVGVAFSGGGARAASAAMGQTRALLELGLLTHVRAISAVSGGSWFSVPFTFLPAHIDDAQFLGPFVADPGALRWDRGDAPEELRDLSPHSFAEPLTKFPLSTAGMTLSALGESIEGVPAHRLWTRKIGKDLLAHFGLASFDHRTELPDNFFAPSSPMARSALMANADLPPRYHTVREGGAAVRPYLIVNGSMRIQGPRDAAVLAPIQFTPYFAGVLGSQIGTLEGAEVGGGAISAFAFGGRVRSREDQRVTVELEAPLALSDIVGISSVAFADLLSDHGIGSLDPVFDYWSPNWSAPGGAKALFEDAGSLEDTGTAALLAYSDIDAIVSFINPSTPLHTKGSAVVVDDQLPALFGLRGFEHGVGYRPYSEPGKGNPDFADNQVFANEDGEFEALLHALSEASAAGKPLVHRQRLQTVPNPKFAVIGERQIDMMWVYLSPSARWQELLDARVQRELRDDFPNYPTLKTELSVGDVNLLAHFTSWVLAQHADDLRSMFFPGQA